MLHCHLWGFTLHVVIATTLQVKDPLDMAVLYALVTFGGVLVYATCLHGMHPHSIVQAQSSIV